MGIRSPKYLGYFLLFLRGIAGKLDQKSSRHNTIKHFKTACRYRKQWLSRCITTHNFYFWSRWGDSKEKLRVSPVPACSPTCCIKTSNLTLTAEKPCLYFSHSEPELAKNMATWLPVHLCKDLVKCNVIIRKCNGRYIYSHHSSLTSEVILKHCLYEYLVN